MGQTMSSTMSSLEPVGYVMAAFPVGQADFSGEMASGGEAGQLTSLSWNVGPHR